MGPGASLLPRLLFITFHGLGEPPASIPEGERPYWVTPATLRETLEAVGELGQAAGADIRIGFDDGNATDIETAAPLLLEHGIKAEIFVLTGRIGQRGSLGRSDIAELARLGFAIGSHGIDHIPWAETDDQRLARELEDSKALLEDITGRPVDGVAIPFGSFDGRVVRRAAAAGYQRIHTSRGGYTWVNRGLIPRYSVTKGFVARRDMPTLLGMAARLSSAIKDPLRRLKYAARLPRT